MWHSWTAKDVELAFKWYITENQNNVAPFMNTYSGSNSNHSSQIICETCVLSLEPLGLTTSVTECICDHLLYMTLLTPSPSCTGHHSLVSRLAALLCQGHISIPHPPLASLSQPLCQLISPQHSSCRIDGPSRACLTNQVPVWCAMAAAVAAANPPSTATAGHCPWVHPL